jgi:hypothetical protein
LKEKEFYENKLKELDLCQKIKDAKTELLKYRQTRAKVKR